MMSMPMLRATSAWLEWARRDGMMTRRAVMPWLLTGRPPVGARWRSWPAVLDDIRSDGILTPFFAHLLDERGHYSTEEMFLLVILFYYLVPSEGSNGRARRSPRTWPESQSRAVERRRRR